MIMRTTKSKVVVVYKDAVSEYLDVIDLQRDVDYLILTTSNEVVIINLRDTITVSCSDMTTDA
jgi:hypothetical protein